MKGGEDNLKEMDKKESYVRVELEVSLFGISDIVTTSSGSDNPYTPEDDLGMWV